MRPWPAARLGQRLTLLAATARAVRPWPAARLGQRLFASGAHDRLEGERKGRRVGLLGLWLAAVSTLPSERVLPIGFGGTAGVTTSAWHGDKILGAAIAAALRARGTTEASNLTRAYSAAASNANMAANLSSLLPIKFLELLPKDALSIQEHGCGTMLEACVDAVAETGNDAAIAELAQFLIDAAHYSMPQCALETNPKGKLLELGGTVTSSSIGGPDHQLVFEAKVCLDGFSATSKGSSKKRAEQDAAVLVLNAAGLLGGSSLPTLQDAASAQYPPTSASRRRPTTRDLVKLNPSLGVVSLQGLLAGQVVKITQDQVSTDPVTPYQVRLETDGMATSPWFKEGDLVLADPTASWPKPDAPENCCGSSCPNCVWIQYQVQCDEWVRITGGTI